MYAPALLVACLTTTLIATSRGHDFQKLYSWQKVDYKFPNETVRNAYVASGDYVQEHNMPLGLAVWRNKMFVTVPRWKNGVASNLNFIPMNNVQNGSPDLIPYPDLETNDIHNADGIVSIFRVRVDACDRLWGIDTGINDILGNAEVVRPVRLIVIDLKTDKIIRKYTLKDTDQKPESFMADLVIDVDTKNCDAAYAYISDLGAYSMVVYSLEKNDSWRIQHNYFYFDPLHGDYYISGYNFQWTDGVFGLSLSPIAPDGKRILYFHSMSGITEFYVSTEVLKDSTTAASKNYHAFHVAGSKGPQTQGPSSVIDQKTGIDYFALVNKNGIGCWDTSVELSPSTFKLAAQDDESMIFPNDLSIEPLSRKLYVLADNLPRFQNSELYKKKSNYYITVANLDSLASLCKQR